jgi:hypothetical protein
MRATRQSTARAIMVLMVDSTDHITGKTGLTLTITASKAGLAFASITPTVTERGSGWYSLALTTAHTDTLGDLALHITGAAADPADLVMEVVAYNPEDATALGLSHIDAAVSTRSTLTQAQIVSDSTPFLGASVAAIKAKTDNLPASPAAVGSLMGLADDAITAAKIAAGAITSSEAPALVNLDAAISTRLATAGYTAPANSDVAAIKAKTDNLPADPADESSLQAAISSRAAPGDAMTLTSAAVDAVLDEAVEGAVTLRQAMRVLLAVLAGKSSGAPAGPIVYRDIGDAKDRVTGTIDSSGNRTSVTVDGA